MGKKKHTGEYNDYLDGEKLRDNAEIRTSLNGPSSSSARQEISPPPPPSASRQDGSHNRGNKKGPPKKPQLTHFLCLPLVTPSSRPQLQAGLEKFTQDLSTHSPNVPTKAVRPLGSLHLTLGAMSLDDKQLDDAKSYLRSLPLHRMLRDITQFNLAAAAAENGTVSENLNAAALPDADFLSIDLEALAPMQDSHKTSILYAKPMDKTGRLAPFAEKLKEQFTMEGYVNEDTRPLRLHATIANTIYAKPKGAQRGRGAKQTLKHIFPHHHDNPESPSPFPGRSSSATSQNSNNDWHHFDARTLIATYKDFTWAKDIRIDKVQICKMGARKLWSGGEEGVGEVVDERYEVVCEREIWGG